MKKLLRSIIQAVKEKHPDEVDADGVFNTFVVLRMYSDGSSEIVQETIKKHINLNEFTTLIHFNTVGELIDYLFEDKND